MPIANLSRKELQQRAIKHGIKANQKSADIIRQLELLEASASAGAAVLAAIDAEGASWDVSLGASSDSSIKDLTPLLKSGGVDMYIAGHWHYYESLYPAKNGADGTGGAPLQKTFVNPDTCVHVTTGNGGPPGKDTFVEDCPGPDCGRIPATRKQTNEFGYSRLVAHNATHLTHEYRFNSNSSLFDSFTLVAHAHGPFPHNNGRA